LVYSSRWTSACVPGRAVFFVVTIPDVDENEFRWWGLAWPREDVVCFPWASNKDVGDHNTAR
jgi:hypothetical protein